MPSSQDGNTLFNWRRWLWFSLIMAVAVGVGLVLRFLPMDEDLLLELTLVGFVPALVIQFVALFRWIGKPRPTSVDWYQILVVLLCVTVAVAWVPKGASGGAAGLGMITLGDIVGRWRSKREASMGYPQPPANG